MGGLNIKQKPHQQYLWYDDMYKDTRMKGIVGSKAGKFMTDSYIWSVADTGPAASAQHFSLKI